MISKILSAFMQHNQQNQVELATRVSRIAAKILDSLILIWPLILIMATEPIEAPYSLMIAISVLLYCGFIFFIQSWLLISKGQTLGKKFLKIKIINPKNNEIPNFFRLIILRSILGLYLSFTIIFLVVDFVALLLPKRRCIHDFMGNSIVVKTNS